MKRMIRLIIGISLALAVALTFPILTEAKPGQKVTAIPKSPDIEIRSATVKYLPDLDLLVFEQQVNGTVGKTLPTPKSKLDGAPVLGYVFPTTLKPEDVGFSYTEGIVALAATSHPDFDDTPLWDENNDGNRTNDGMLFHAHWVILVKDARAAGGFAVKQFKKGDSSVVLPPTNPGLPMYMDSPGFVIVLNRNSLKVLVPAQRINHKTNFKFDGVTAYMQVNTSDPQRPMLGVYEVYGVLSKNLSLPYTVQR